MHTAHPLHQQHRRIRQVQTLPGSPATVAERLLSDPPGGRGQGPVPVGYVRFLESNNRVLFTFHTVDYLTQLQIILVLTTLRKKGF